MTNTQGRRWVTDLLQTTGLSASGIRSVLETAEATGHRDYQADRWLTYHVTYTDADGFAVTETDTTPASLSLASCGHPRNEDGECDCAWWPERAPVPNPNPAPKGHPRHQIREFTVLAKHGNERARPVKVMAQTEHDAILRAGLTLAQSGHEGLAWIVTGVHDPAPATWTPGGATS